MDAENLLHTLLEPTSVQNIILFRIPGFVAFKLDQRRRYGVHPNTVSAWKAKYGGMESTEIARSRAVDDENTRLRRIVANLTLENDAMKQLIEKTPGALSAKRSGEGIAGLWFELTRRVSHYRLPAIGRAVSVATNRRP
jgi:hypothetical protein